MKRTSFVSALFAFFILATAFRCGVSEAQQTPPPYEDRIKEAISFYTGTIKPELLNQQKEDVSLAAEKMRPADPTYPKAEDIENEISNRFSGALLAVDAHVADLNLLLKQLFKAGDIAHWPAANYQKALADLQQQEKNDPKKYGPQLQGFVNMYDSDEETGGLLPLSYQWVNLGKPTQYPLVRSPEAAISNLLSHGPDKYDKLSAIVYIYVPDFQGEPPGTKDKLSKIYQIQETSMTQFLNSVKSYYDNFEGDPKEKDVLGILVKATETTLADIGFLKTFRPFRWVEMGPKGDTFDTEAKWEVFDSALWNIFTYFDVTIYGAHWGGVGDPNVFQDWLNHALSNVGQVIDQMFQKALEQYTKLLGNK